MKVPVRRLEWFAALVAAAAGLTAFVGPHAQARNTWRDRGASALEGLWAADTTLGPELRGPLAIRRDGRGRWTGAIGAASATADSLHLRFPGGRGEFRGALVAGGREIRGWWIQPAGPVQGVPYASPLTLARVAPGRWRGDVVPLDERFELFLTVSRAPDGSLAAVFRNPEQGVRMGAARFALAQAGDSLVFTAGGTRPVRFAAVFDSAHRAILVHIPAIGTTLRLRRPTSSPPGSVPRPPASPAYEYRKPRALPDGWPVAAPGDVAMDRAALVTLVRRFAAQDPIADTAPAVHSVLVARHGELVLDEYFYGYDRDRPHDLRSASKTFTSVMIGAARARGLALDTLTRVVALFGGEEPFSNADSRKRDITLAHLLTHTSGLACDDNDDDSPGNEGTMQSQTAEPDWYRYTLGLPMTHAPGDHYAYCSGGMNLAGGALARSTGAWLPALFDTLVARPLGLGRWYMNLMPTGQGYSGGGVHLRPRDLLKFGDLYLRGGTWRGRRIVDSAWVRASITPHVMTGEGSADGLAWHLNTLHAPGRDYREYEANGNGGQFLIVVPELDLVVVFTAGDYMRYYVWRHLRDDVVAREIIGALRDR